ncbi:MAG: penicillin-binding protein 2 [Actinomycetota bacterium]
MYENELVERRVAVLAFLILAAAVIILVRLLFLQVIQGREFVAIATENKIREVALDAVRGDVYDRNGVLMVGNRPSYVVSMTDVQASKGEDDVKEEKDVIKRLAGVLGVSPKAIEERLNNRRIDPYKPAPIKEDVNEQVAVYLKEHQLEFPHILIEGKPVREYPNGNTGAHILGYLGEVTDKELKENKFKDYHMGDVIGREGVELSYEKELAGKSGLERIEVNAAGYPVSSVVIRKPKPGQDITMTIDKNLQALSENLLAEALIQARQAYDKDTQKYYNAPAGAVVVMDPNNGEILAMASQPSYDPRLFSHGISDTDWKALNDPANHYPLNNRAMANSFPPGSTIKGITGSAALQEGVASAVSEYNCTGKWTGAGDQWPQFCWLKTGHGRLTLEEGIIQSCDTVFYEIGLAFYKLISSKGEKMQEYAAKFGLGKPTGVDLPGEDGGRVPTKDWKRKWNKNDPEYQIWYPGDSTNMAIGQGDVLATPLQMANVYAAIANGGTLFKPHIVKKVVSPDKGAVSEVKSAKIRNVGIDPALLGIVRDDLVQVVTDGTGKSAFGGWPLDSIPIAGKTGSAEMYGKQASAWFVAYAPADKPQYVVVVMIEEGGHGVSAAAPVARKILESLFGLSSDSEIRIESSVD